MLKVGDESITFEGSAPWEDEGSGERKLSTIPGGFEGGEGIAAEGPTIMEDSEGEESSAAEGLFISEGSGEREGSAAVD